MIEQLEIDKKEAPVSVWRKFSGFEAIPTQHTDHFIGRTFKLLLNLII
jgi:hypothetical protein